MRLEIVLCFLLIASCYSRTLPDDDDDSVVSIYTTLPSTVKTSKSLDVYHQIANNIAERLTSPIYRFLGFGKNKTQEASTKRVWESVELLDETPEEVTNKNDPDIVDNNLDNERDVEELSVEGLTKNTKKPEKFTLYSSYLPVNNEKLTVNNTLNEVDGEFDDDEPFEFDDPKVRPRDSGFVYYLELIGSFIQLAWGAVLALFSPKTT